jgi:hypothetical protein
MMRAAAINFNLSRIQCPYCRSQAEKMSSLIVCSDCKTFYHRECWQQNNGCSVFGCDGIMNDFKKRRGEPGWLIALRILVFGFPPSCFISMLITRSIWMDLFLATWGMAFIPASILLLILEIIYLYRVYKRPELNSKYGNLVYHVLSISAYGVFLFMLFVSILILPIFILRAI